MIFLVEYIRQEGRLVRLDPFESSVRKAAQNAKLNLELELHRQGLEREVVLLEAESEAELRKGYRRYFEDLPTMLRSAMEQVKLG